MTQVKETYLVKFANRSAIQQFQDARELIEQAIEDAPWNDDLRQAKDCLDAAWLGLAFSVQEA